MKAAPISAVRKFVRQSESLYKDKGISTTITFGDGDRIQVAGPGDQEGASMSKTRATIDKTTGEVVEDRAMLHTDLKDLERAIATAYGELVSLKEAKDAATLDHKEGQERLNSLVAELTRRVNGEQPLPL